MIEFFKKLKELVKLNFIININNKNRKDIKINQKAGNNSQVIQGKNITITNNNLKDDNGKK